MKENNVSDERRTDEKVRSRYLRQVKYVQVIWGKHIKEKNRKIFVVWERGLEEGRKGWEARKACLTPTVFLCIIKIIFHIYFFSMLGYKYFEERVLSVVGRVRKPVLDNAKGHLTSCYIMGVGCSQRKKMKSEKCEHWDRKWYHLFVIHPFFIYPLSMEFLLCARWRLELPT